MLSLGLGSALAFPTSFGLVVRAYSPASHDRFLDFGTAAVRHNPGFFRAAQDLTGVGWDADRTVRQLTLVSPQHFVGANHFKPPEGATIHFLSGDGVLRSAEVASREAIPNGQGEASDLFIGTLAAPIPASGVRFHPYLNLPLESDYVGKELIVLGKRARGGRNVILGFTDVGEGSAIGGGTINSTRMFSFTYSDVAGGSDDAHSEAGDSGSPSFVLHDGTAALVGTHSLLASTSGPLGAGTYTTFDAFVPHYVEELNARMAPKGYHMTAVSPASTSLQITQESAPGVLRAGYPFALEVEIENVDSADANNLKLWSSASVPGSTVAGAGSGWVVPVSGPDRFEARRGGLNVADSSRLTLDVTIPQPGAAEHEVTVSADEFGADNHLLHVEVIESFRSWSAGLPNVSPGADDDRDGVELLLEYAFGGDPSSGSTFLPGTEIPLLPQMGGGEAFTLRYLMRSDADERLLEYQVEYTHDLGEGDWKDAASLISSTTATSVHPGMNLVEVHLTPSEATHLFVRLRVSLHE